MTVSGSKNRSSCRQLIQFLLDVQFRINGTVLWRFYFLSNICKETLNHKLRVNISFFKANEERWHKSQLTYRAVLDSWGLFSFFLNSLKSHSCWGSVTLKEVNLVERVRYFEQLGSLQMAASPPLPQLLLILFLSVISCF